MTSARRRGTALFVLLAAAGASMVTAASAQPAARVTAPSPVRTPMSWYDAGTPRTVWMAPGEIAVFFRPGSRPTAGRMSAMAARAGATALLPGSDASVMYLRAGGAQRTSARVASTIERLADVVAVSPVFYAASNGTAGRRALTGQVLIHPRAGQSRPNLARAARRYGLKYVHAYSFSDAALFKSKNPAASLRAANALQLTGRVRFAYPNWSRTIVPQTTPNDTLFGDQWHLANVGQGGAKRGEDLNVTPVWNTFRGSANEVIAVTDGGIETAHEDLGSQVLTGLSWDYVDGDADQNPGNDPNNPWDSHGTAVAGLAAAAGFNGIGVSGVAPSASLIGYRIGTNTTDAQLADAMVRNMQVMDISSNSWGPEDGTLDGPSTICRDAMKSGVAQGRGGKGVVYVFAAGNGGDEDNSNYDGFAAMRQTIAVAASNANGGHPGYSERGANILVNAPSNDAESEPCAAIATLRGGYRGVLYLPELYRFRNEFLARSSTGRHLTNTYYRYSGEVASLVLKNPEVRASALSMLDAWMPAIRALSADDGGATVSSKQVAALQAFASKLAGAGSAELRHDLSVELARARVAGAAGGTIETLWHRYAAASTGRRLPVPRVTLAAGLPGITTTDRTGSLGYSSDGYTSEFGGTSAACPQVSGVVALMLQANPNLTWRDAQQILAETADVNDSSNSEWTVNASGYFINDQYGFGRVNATRAVTAAQSWRSDPSEVVAAKTAWPRRRIPDHNQNGVVSHLSIPNSIKVNYVEVVFSAADHAYWGDLRITLTSPSGTSSLLAQEHYASRDQRYGNWVFGSTRHYGESSRGRWTLKVADLMSDDVGTFQSWTLRVYGTSNTAVVASPPTTGSVPTSNSYRITWGPLSPSSAIAAYDVRHRESGSPWRTWKTNTIYTHGTFRGTQGRTYYFSVRTRGRDGSLSAYSSAQAVVIPFNDRAARYHGSWALRRRAGTYYMGGARITRRYHAWLGLRFRGRKVALIVTRGPRRAPAQVYIDSRRVGTIYTIARGTHYRMLTRFFLVANPRSLHTLRVFHADRRRGRTLEIDGFYVQQ